MSGSGYLIAKGGAGNPEDLRGAGFILAGCFQDPADMPLLHFGKGAQLFVRESRGRGLFRAWRATGNRQPLALCEKHFPLDQVFQLTDIAGPWPAEECLFGFRRQPLDLLAQLPAVSVEKVVGKEENVPVPLAQRGRGNGDDVEPVVEILPEIPGPDLLLQIEVAGGDDPQINRNILQPRPF